MEDARMAETIIQLPAELRSAKVAIAEVWEQNQK
jgi:hypothetical protein